ncbi:hypothetical protein ABW21_db0209249 [Orbilia brochopaga]|nr:hypothetical protein ABW21_db0209249 [Drechslerella brochopaga]
MGKISVFLTILLATRSTWAAPSTDALVGRGQLMKRAVIGTTFIPEWTPGGNKIPKRQGTGAVGGWIAQSSPHDAPQASSDENCAAWCDADSSCNFAVRLYVTNSAPASNDGGWYCEKYANIVLPANAKESSDGTYTFYFVSAWSKVSTSQDIVPTGFTLGVKTNNQGWYITTKRSDPTTTPPKTLSFGDCKQICDDYRQPGTGIATCAAIQYGQEANNGLYFCDLYSVDYDIDNNNQNTIGVKIYIRASTRTSSYWANNAPF